VALPLANVRVVDMTDGLGEGTARCLADLGADVVLVEPPGGVQSRHARPTHHGVSFSFVSNAANKRSVVVDLAAEAGRERLLGLLAGADIWIEGTEPGALEVLGIGVAEVRRRFPHLVVLSISAFGHTGPYRNWVATGWVHLALAGVLSRSGVPGRPPFMPPGPMADSAASIQAAWVALVAYWASLESGLGDHLDFSVFEATAQVIDPVFGSIGTAAAAQAAGFETRGRPSPLLYPVFRCADGHVRTVMLAPRQWRGMFSWLGEPEQFADPKFDEIVERFMAAGELYPLIEARFREATMMDLVAEGQRRGVPIAPVLHVAEVLHVEHFAARGVFEDIDLEGHTGKLASGPLLMDGARAGVRSPAPAEPGAHEDRAVDWSPRQGMNVDASARDPDWRRPLSGLRVLDLGVIVMGAEAGRMFADQGADVIKVENRRFPDGARARGMSAAYASGHRNKRAIGIDLRHEEGAAIFEQLVAVSDVVLSNFKPGTLESLGLGYERLSAINPGIVLVTSSAMGESGPWRDWMGYGPLVRCVSGLTGLWRDPDVDSGFGDTSTIYPDHMVGRLVDIGVLAALVARRSSGRGAHIESSQAEAIICALAPIFLRESVDAGAARPLAYGEMDAPWGVYPCEGDDEWCVITVRDDADWSRLADVVGETWSRSALLTTQKGRIGARREIDRSLSAWTARHAPREVADMLQAARVPAAPMLRVTECGDDPHLRDRDFFRDFVQPGVEGEVTVEAGPTRAARLPDPDLRPAPFLGQHTRSVGRELLALGDHEIDELVRRGVLQEAGDEIGPERASATPGRHA
jgi:crotonobetainyl-CoA:carnitine CoA-transferase CaiB-like acyl-CoA transferase